MSVRIQSKFLKKRETKPSKSVCFAKSTIISATLAKFTLTSFGPTNIKKPSLRSLILSYVRIPILMNRIKGSRSWPAKIFKSWLKMFILP
jgi:hypothetical protein